MQATARSDDGVFTDAGEGKDAGILADLRAGMDIGACVDPVCRRFRVAEQMPNDDDERVQWIGDLDQGEPVGCHRYRHHSGGGARMMQLRDVFFIFNKGDVTGKSFFQRAGGVDHQAAVSQDLAFNQFRQFPQSDAHATSFLP